MSEPTDYTVESLYKLFLEHAEKADKNHAELIKEFQTNHPQEPIPAWMNSDFNLPRALATICGEILCR